MKAAERVTPKEYLRLLPHKKISHIYSNIDTMQRQIISLIAHALDMDGEKKSVSEKMVAYYNAEGNDTLYTFQFQPQPVNFEVIDRRIFAEVLTNCGIQEKGADTNQPDNIQNRNPNLKRVCTRQYMLWWGK